MKYLLVFFLSLWSAVASAATLKQVQVSGGSQIELLFDGKVSKSQIKTEFFNDIIQVSLTDTSVYPAKISSITGGSLTKIFAYQYAPKLVRCRLSVKGKAEDYKERFQVIANGASGKILSLRLSEVAAAPVQAKAPMSNPFSNAVKTGSATKKSAPAVASSTQVIEENALLEKIMKSEPPKVTAAAAPAAASLPVKQQQEAPQGKQHLAGGKGLPSPLSILAKLAAVIALFLGLAALAKRFAAARSGWEAKVGARIAKGIGVEAHAEKSGGKLLGGLGSLFTPTRRKGKMIEVLSSHYLGPKKSIVVAKVMGRTLVLGVTNESINLISRLPGGHELDDHDDFDFKSEDGVDLFLGETSTPMPKKASGAQAYAQTAAQAPVRTGASGAFSAMLSAEARKPQDSFNVGNASVRNQIRNRLEGFKPL